MIGWTTQWSIYGLKVLKPLQKHKSNSTQYSKKISTKSKWSNTIGMGSNNIWKNLNSIDGDSYHSLQQKQHKNEVITPSSIND